MDDANTLLIAYFVLWLILINLLAFWIIGRIDPQGEEKEAVSFDPKRGEDIWMGCNVSKMFYDANGKELDIFNGQIVDVDDDADNVGHRIFQVVYEDGDDEWVSAEEIASIIDDEYIGTVPATSTDTGSATSASAAASATASASAAASTTTNTSDISPAPTTKKKKPSKYEHYQSAPDNAVYFLFDVEVTGSKRNYDRIIQMAFISYDDTGKLLDNFCRLVNPGKVRINQWIKDNILPNGKL